MTVWQPHGNKFFETFSFLPPLSDQEVARQVQYLLNNGWTPCIEFESASKAYADTHGWSGLDSSVTAGYYDNRYWVMWKLPMYGCTNPDEVLQEIRACTPSPSASSASPASTTSSRCSAPPSLPTAPPVTAPSRPSPVARSVVPASSPPAAGKYPLTLAF